MRIVLDTAILVRATAKAIGPARLLLERIAAGGHQLFLSPFLLEETERVLNYPRIQVLYGLSLGEIRGHVDSVRAVAEIVDPVVGEPVVLKDRNEDPAVVARADESDVLEFCRMRNIGVMTDVDLLKILVAEGHEK